MRMGWRRPARHGLQGEGLAYRCRWSGREVGGLWGSLVDGLPVGRKSGELRGRRRQR